MDAIAICDHDCIDAIAPCRALGDASGLEVVPSVELTGEKLDVEVHLLGYFVDWEADWFQGKLKTIQDSRVKRIHRMVEALEGEGVTVDADEVFKLSGRGSVGRLHLAQVMLRTGRIRNLKEAFDKYIGFSKPCYVPNTKFSPTDAIELIIKAGGVPVLAHPHSMGKDEYIPEFVEYGLKGIEVYHTDHSGGVRSHYEELAGRYNLITTGGSDCHGMNKGRVLMGSVKVPYTVVERLKEESERIRREGR